MRLAHSTTKGVGTPPKPPLRPNCWTRPPPIQYKRTQLTPTRSSESEQGNLLLVFTPSCCSRSPSKALIGISCLASSISVDSSPRTLVSNTPSAGNGVESTLDSSPPSTLPSILKISIIYNPTMFLPHVKNLYCIGIWRQKSRSINNSTADKSKLTMRQPKPHRTVWRIPPGDSPPLKPARVKQTGAKNHAEAFCVPLLVWYGSYSLIADSAEAKSKRCLVMRDRCKAAKNTKKTRTIGTLGVAHWEVLPTHQGNKNLHLQVTEQKSSVVTH